MSSPSRTSQYQKLQKILKKHYKPCLPDPNRSVLEQLLMACCLENAHHEAADEAFLGLVHNFFDWNEVRVSTVRELGEVMPRLPDPAAAAHRVKRVLQSIFESLYRFDMEDLRKMNLGPATEKLRSVDGTTNFSAAYVVQAALGGHAIPVDEGTARTLRILDLVTEEHERACVAPGLERAIPKSKGAEFASILHQLGADFVANPYAARFRQILLEIDPKIGDRLPKRRAKKQARADEADSGPGDSADVETAVGGSPVSKGARRDVQKGGTGKRKATEGQEGRKRKKRTDEVKGAAQRKKTAPRELDDEATQKKAASQAKRKAAAKSKSPQDETQSPHGGGKKPSASRISKKKPR